MAHVETKHLAFEEKRALTEAPWEDLSNRAEVDITPEWHRGARDVFALRREEAEVLPGETDEPHFARVESAPLAERNEVEANAAHGRHPISDGD